MTTALDQAEAAMELVREAINSGQTEQSHPGMGKGIDRTTQIANTSALLSIARSLESIAHDIAVRNG